ncbi:MAG: APC family permease [Vulcanisaeta sp.]
MGIKVDWLRRDLSTIDLLALGYSDVSSTYYFTLGIIALYSGSALPIIMLVGSLSMWLIGLAYAEFGSAIPRTGGAYYYIKRELGNFMGFIAGWLLSFDQILMIAYGALGTTNYLSGVLSTLRAWPINSLFSIIIVLMLMIINILGIKLSARFNLFLLTIDLLGILLLLWIGYTHVILSKALNGFKFQVEMGNIINGLAYSLRGYTGIDVIAQSTGEALVPAISVPRAIIGVSSLSVIIALLLSLLVLLTGAISSISIEDPIGSLARYVIHSIYMITYISVSIAIVLLIAVNAGLIDFSRSMYVMSEDKLLPRVFSRVHGRYRTPYISIIISSLIAIAFIAPGSVDIIASSYGIASTIVYLMTMASLIRFRNYERKLVRYFHTPGITIGGLEIPLISLIGFIVYGMAIILIAMLKPLYLVIVLLWLVVGIVIYQVNKVSPRT